MERHFHTFTPRPGRLRDMPAVEVVSCESCLEIRHATSVRDKVSYALGTMHRGPNEEFGLVKKTSEDNVRRSERIKAIVSEMTEPAVQLLDFGCGEGEFLETLASINGLSCLGYDIDPTAVRVAEETGCQATTDLGQLSHQRFDVVTMMHVIEHLYEPLQELRDISRVMKPGAKLIIETPNATDALINLYECEAFMDFTFWSHHPIIYSAMSLQCLLEEAGFTVTSAGFTARYGLDNHLHWLSRGLPGGHTDFPKIFSSSLDELYKKELVETGVADTLWFEAKFKKT